MHALNGKRLTPRQSAQMSRVLESTKHLLAEVGVEGMTMRDLAVMSGVSAATLYNRFGTKDNVIAHAVSDHYERKVRSVLERGGPVKTPVDQIIQGTHTIVRNCRRRQGFARALMNTYFKIGNAREMPAQLYQALYQTWLPPLEEMRASGSIHDWVVLPLLCEELCDRMFGMVMKWAQGTLSLAVLTDRTLFSLLSSLAGVSRGVQARELAALLGDVSQRMAQRAQAG